MELLPQRIIQVIYQELAADMGGIGYITAFHAEIAKNDTMINVHMLEAAREIVFDRGRDVQFVLVGGGPALDDLKDETERLGLADHVTFTGRAPDEDLFEVLSTADVCVNPDRVNPMNDKSTMNKIMEYMAFSKPMVQFDVTEGRHSAQDASLYAAANDTSDLAAKLLELLDDPDRCAQMGAYGRKRVETELSWDYQVDALIAAYQRAKA